MRFNKEISKPGGAAFFAIQHKVLQIQYLTKSLTNTTNEFNQTLGLGNKSTCTQEWEQIQNLFNVLIVLPDDKFGAAIFLNEDENCSVFSYFSLKKHSVLIGNLVKMQ